MDGLRDWVENSPFGVSLGVRLTDVSEEGASLALPYLDRNSNPGQALHGGCAASLAAIGGQVMARATLGEKQGPFHTAGIQVSYLAAAIGEDVVAEAKLLRRGKEMCFVTIDIANSSGKAIAHASNLVRGRAGGADATRYEATGDHGESDPGAMGPHVGKMPFTAERGLEVEHMSGGKSRVVMPRSEKNRIADGGVHEGAVLALLDTAGAMASWGETGPGAFKASTPALQAQILAPSVDDDLVAYGQLVQRDQGAFWADVEVAGRSDAQVIARGTVLYRILT